MRAAVAVHKFVLRPGKNWKLILASAGAVWGHVAPVAIREHVGFIYHGMSRRKEHE
jgi:hypothetical protein